MRMNARYKVMGEFRTQLIRRDGTVRWDSGFHKNLIVDAGLAYLTSGVSDAALMQVRTLQVGSGNTAPDVADTALETFVAGVVNPDSLPSSDPNYNPSSEIVGSDAIGHIERIYEFDFDEANDNLREVGVRFGSSGTLWARDLLRDIGGNPVTIEKTNEDQLRVTYRISVYVALAEVLTEDQSLNLLGVPTATDVRVRPQNMPGATINSTNNSNSVTNEVASPRLFTSAGVILYPDNTPRGVFTQTGPASTANSVSVTVTGSSGSFVVAVNNGVTGDVYWIERQIRIAPSAGNVAGGLIGSIALAGGAAVGAPSAGQQPWIMHFDPKIPKDNTQRLDITVRHHWERV